VGRVVVIGERARVAGFTLAGADVRPADDDAAVCAAWPLDEAAVAVVVLTPAAARVLGQQIAAALAPARPLVVVLP
jgi:vacuolar-type H+-ATPase subunit F/Vma7